MGATNHTDGCACDTCMPTTQEAELIHVGLPFLHDTHNGHAIATALNGEVMVKVSGWALGELSMPLNEARTFRDQLSKAIEQA